MTQKTVLIVDDEPAIREMIAVALEMADYRYLEAGDTRQAHSSLSTKARPDSDGLDVAQRKGVEFARRLKKIRARPKFHHHVDGQNRGRQQNPRPGIWR